MNVKEFWRDKDLKVKRSKSSTRTYRYGMNATIKKTTEQPDMATILEQCANATMNSQQQLQEQQ